MDDSSPAATDLETIVSAVAAAKKYRSLCSDTVRRVAARELSHHLHLKEAIKATKRRLHQVYGAFEAGIDYDALYELLAAAYAGGSEENVRAACRQVMAAHSSTRERLPILDRFYPAIWRVTGRPGSILDLGCGLNPLAWPWMDLVAGEHETRYIALDIDAERIRFLNRYLALAGLAPLARCQDLLAQPPTDKAGVALLLKMSPSLERQEEGATLRLVDQLHAPFVVVSFAVRSLGGRERGMIEHYGQQFRVWARGRRWQVEELGLDTELVCVVHKT